MAAPPQMQIARLLALKWPLGSRISEVAADIDKDTQHLV
jgi:hypothetical protein